MGELTNATRADAGEAALNAFLPISGIRGSTFARLARLQPDKGDDAYCAVVDLIANLLHVADRYGWSAENIIATAQGHHGEESAMATTEQLADEFDAWLAANLPDKVTAGERVAPDELLHELVARESDTVKPFIEWLQAFVIRWEAAQDREDFESACAARGEP